MSKYIPNSFQIPNVIIDEHMAGLSGTAFKCYAFITRQTTGWGKEVDHISVSQFKARSGIQKDKTITDALAELEALKLIVSIKAKGRITAFRLNLDFEDSEPQPPTILVPTKIAGTKTATTPENGGVVPPKMGGGSTPENGGSTKHNTKPTNTKGDLSVSKSFELPDWVPEKEWAGFLEMRKAIGKPVPTEYAKELLIDELEVFKNDGYLPEQILKQSIANSWPTLWPIKSFLAGEPAAKGQSAGVAKPSPVPTVAADTQPAVSDATKQFLAQQAAQRSAGTAAPQRGPAPIRLGEVLKSAGMKQ